MSRLSLLLLSWLAVFALTNALPRGELKENMLPGPSPDVETSVYFPDYPEDRYPLGEAVTVLCHVQNNGAIPMNISSLYGTLSNAFDYNTLVQKYNVKTYNFILKPSEEITLHYTFDTHPDLEAGDFILAHTVFYHTESEVFSATFFNKTVELFRETSDYDVDVVMPVIGSVFFTVFSALVVLFACVPEQSNPFLKRVNPNAAKKAVVEDDWDIDLKPKTKQSKGRK